MMAKRITAVLLYTFSTCAFCIDFPLFNSVTVGSRADGIMYITQSTTISTPTTSSDASCTGLVGANAAFITADADPSLKAAILQAKAFGLPFVAAIKDCTKIDGSTRLRVNEIYF